MPSTAAAVAAALVLTVVGLVVWTTSGMAGAALFAAGAILLLLTLILTCRRLARENAALREHVTTLRDSAARLQDFIELASDWFWEQDAALRFTWGSGIESLRALADDNFIGRTRWEFGTLRGDDAAWEAHKADLAARRPFRDFRYRHISPDGRVRHLSVSGRPVYDSAGTFVGYRGTGNDVTALVEGETALRRGKEMAEAANRAKSEFLANMGHELRTPLNAIIGFSELIRDQPFGSIDARYAQYARDIHASGERLLHLLNEVLALARLEANRYVIRDERIFVGSVLRAAARTLSDTAQQAGVRIDCGHAVEDVAVLADRWAVNHVMLSLLGNALRFTQAAGLVAVTAAIVPDGACVITVTDTGIGIEPAELENVFEPFYQIDASHSRTHGGAGIGLATCRKLLALHDGTIEISSTPGQGTTVTVMLPRERVLGRRGADAAIGA